MEYTNWGSDYGISNNVSQSKLISVNQGISRNAGWIGGWDTSCSANQGACWSKCWCAGQGSS